MGVVAYQMTTPIYSYQLQLNPTKYLSKLFWVTALGHRSEDL